jgi:predicted amidohydrolase YtcJ
VVLRGGCIYTLNPSSPRAEALAIRKGRISFVGSNDDATKSIGPGTEIIELAGRFAVPGFNDAHIHFAPSMLQQLSECGITTVQSISSPSDLCEYRRMAEQGKLTVRIDVRLPIEVWRDYPVHSGSAETTNGMVRVIGLKAYVDGMLRDRSAYMLLPYPGCGASRGKLTQSVSESSKFDELLSHATEVGADVSLHAIGDGAVRVALDGYERLIERHPNTDHRHRIVHATFVSPRDLHRFGRSRIIAEVNPYHVNAMPWLKTTVGEDSARWAFAFRTLKNNGATICFGSDYPGLERDGEFPLSPLRGIQAAVLHLNTSERLSVADALSAYTIAPAFAARSEHVKGTLETGKMADIIVLSENPFDVSAERIGEIRVELTMVGGVIEFQRHVP